MTTEVVLAAAVEEQAPPRPPGGAAALPPPRPCTPEQRHQAREAVLRYLHVIGELRAAEARLWPLVVVLAETDRLPDGADEWQPSIRASAMDVEGFLGSFAAWSGDPSLSVLEARLVSLFGWLSR